MSPSKRESVDTAAETKEPGPSKPQGARLRAAPRCSARRRRQGSVPPPPRSSLQATPAFEAGTTLVANGRAPVQGASQDAPGHEPALLEHNGRAPVQGARQDPPGHEPALRVANGRAPVQGASQDPPDHEPALLGHNGRAPVQAASQDPPGHEPALHDHNGRAPVKAASQDPPGHEPALLEHNGRGALSKSKPAGPSRPNGALLRSSISFSSAAGVVAIGGFVFWLLVARIGTTRTVGEAAALYSSVMFVNYLTALGLPVAVARYGSGPKNRPSILFNWAVLLTIISSFIGAAIYLAFVPHTLEYLHQIGVIGSIGIFGIIVSGISISTLLDVRLISQQRRGWVVGKAIFVALLRLPFLVIPGVSNSVIAIFLVAAGAPAICGVLVWLIADLRWVQFRYPLRPLPASASVAAKYSAVNGAAQLAMQGPSYILPVLVLITVTPAENASFYVAWTIATVLFLVAQGVSQALLVEGHRTGGLASQTRSALRLGVLLGLLLAAASVCAAVLIPIVYGSSYTAARTILPVLGVGVIPWSIFTVVLSATRVSHRQRLNIELSVFFAASVLLPAVILMNRFGIRGAAWSWLLGNMLSATVAMFVLHRMRRTGELDAVEPISLDDVTALEEI